MKKNLHPQYNKATIVTCSSCSTAYVIGTTADNFSVEVCANCHPHYTGKQGIMIDTDDLVKKFEARKASADTSKVVMKKKKVQERNSSKVKEFNPTKLTLKDMLKGR